MASGDFSDRLVELRRERGLTQVELAARIGVHPSQLHRYEAGTAQPGLDTLRKLCTALFVPADALLFSDDTRLLVADPLRSAFESCVYLSIHEQVVIAEVIAAFVASNAAKQRPHRARGPLQRRKRTES